jgi:DNA mismatch repair ATPase MutS
MASAIAKKPCPKCSKGIGVATCDGCQQSFCIKHFGEHRQELSHQMDSVGQEHDLLQRDLNQQNIEHPFISRINTWERESMTKIQVAAQAARDDLQKLLDINKKELK